MLRRTMDIDGIREGILSGDRRSLARAITIVENRRPGGKDLVRSLAGHGSAYLVGLTGPPGAGKSTLAYQLAVAMAGRGSKVAVLAVDPTSPFTGGAILGDRIRMQDSDRTGELFIRSMASRGHAGGLARAAADAVRLMTAAGHDLIIVETVGAGQGEVEIMRHADTTLVVLVPGLGDDIQAIKAGILEIGDLFVVNKADLGGADRVVRQLQLMLDLKPDGGWRPAIVEVVAREGQGVEELVSGIEEHRQYLTVSGEDQQRRQQAARAELRSALAEHLLEQVLASTEAGEKWAEAVHRLAARESDPYSEVEQLMSYWNVNVELIEKGGSKTRDEQRCEAKPDG